MNKRILFLGGGRRVELASLFYTAGYSLYSYELNINQPISQYATIIKGLPWNSQDIYIDIMRTVQENHIDMVIPLQDEAVLVISKLYQDVDALVLTPAECVANICFDKLLFMNYMNMFYPEYYPYPYMNSESFVIKPRFGFGSRGIEFVSQEELYAKIYGDSTTAAKDSIVQRFVSGKEYSVDCYFNSWGSYVDGVPRERIRTAGGEVITSKTMEFSQLQHICDSIGSNLKIIGPANFQFIVDEETKKPYLLEINCRFGGGSTLSIAAGLDIISLIGRDYFGLKYNYIPNTWKKNLLLERSYRDHFYENSD